MIITTKERDYIRGQKEGENFSLAVDFGLRQVSCKREGDYAFLDGERLDLKEKMKEQFCYSLQDNTIEKIAFFSQDTNRFYKLLPTKDWPTVAISSVPMHRVNSAKEDTRNKIDLLKPYGLVLDTCFGLGYTAIMAAGAGAKVISFEKDKNIIDLARLNPVSEAIFGSQRIDLHEADVSQGLGGFLNGYFDCIIHDPPTFKLAPELYNLKFYAELFRVLREGGRMFHYTPLYKVKHGYDFPAQIKKKLKKQGFKTGEFSKTASGFLCRK